MVDKDRVIDKSLGISRTSVPFMDERLGWAFPVLDHGFIRVIDYMGDDQAIEQAARISYGAGTRKRNETRGLINYLMSHHHSTPFEMCEIKLHIKLPIFVARQWIRHRTANVNEYSARYSILDREFYIPEAEYLAVQSTDNKQGRSEVLSPEQAREIQQWLLRGSSSAYDSYLDVIKPVEDGGHYGLARELARMNLPTNIYTQWYWKTDLHNLFHFLMLRADSHAQKEIRDYAEVIEKIVEGWVPLAWDAFKTYRKEALSFSARETELIQKALMDGAHEADHKPAWADALSNREWKAFQEKIRRIYRSAASAATD